MPQTLGTLYFRADDGVHGDELWMSDGTESETVMVKDIRPGSTGSINSNAWACMGGNYYFSADDGTSNYCLLWRSDGSEAGTYCVKDAFPVYPEIDALAVIGNMLYFSSTMEYMEQNFGKGTAWMQAHQWSRTFIRARLQAANIGGKL